MRWIHVRPGTWLSRLLTLAALIGAVIGAGIYIAHTSLVVGAVLAGIALILSGASWLVANPAGKIMASVSSAFLLGAVYFWYLDPHLSPNFEVIVPDAPENGSGATTTPARRFR